MKRAVSGVFVHLLAVLTAVFVLADPVQAQDGGTIKWTKLPGTAVDVSINADGQAYVIAPDGSPWRWDKVEQRWRHMSGKFVRITAAEGNRPWAINADGVVYRYNGLWWEDKDKDVGDVAADTKGNVYIAKTNGEIKKWYPLRSEWRPFEGTAVRMALDAEGHLWVVTHKGSIRSFDGKNWVIRPGRARDIALGGTDVAAIADADGRVRTWDGGHKRWTVVQGVSGVSSLGVTPQGKIWAIVKDGVIMANGGLVSEETVSEEDTATDPKAEVQQAPAITAPMSSASIPVTSTPAAPIAAAAPVVVTSTTADAAGKTSRTTATTTDYIDPVTVTTNDQIVFINTLKTASSVAVGADGSVFGLDSASTVLRWSNRKKTFDTFPGSLVRIAVDKDGHPWGVSALGRVFRHTGTMWKQIVNVTASDISIGYDGTVIIVNAAGRLYKLNDSQTVITLIPGSGVVVAVAPDGTPWTIRTDKLVQRCDVSPCKIYGQKANSISVGPDGSVWIVSDSNQLMRLNKKEKFETVQTPGHTPQRVAVGPMGYPWVVSSASVVLASTYFDRDEGADLSEAAATPASGTTGTGATASVVSTSSTSSFVFTKNLTFQNVSFTSLASGTCPKLETDSEGLIWAHNSGGNLEQYDAAKRKFVKRSTAFDGWDHTAFDVAPDGAIWASTLNPHTGLYRAYKGVTKQYFISGSTYFDDISVAPDGTVYVAVSISSQRYLYYKSPGSEAFKKFSTYNNVRKVTVGAGGDIWISDADIEIRRWNGSSFERPENVTFSAAEISASKVDGTLYVRKNGSSDLYKWNPSNKSFDKINNLTVDTFAVDGDGRPWICRDTTPIIERAKD